MAKAEKLLAAMRANPRDWSIDDVARLCRSAGLACNPPTGGGSHYKVSGPSSGQILTIPFNRPIKPVYIRALVRMIDEGQVDD